MNIKQLMLTLFFVFASFFCDAQNKEQEGKVKTRGRLGDDGKVIPGMAISDASIILKGGNSTVSEKNGDFSILLPSETYFLQNVQKQGYVIVDQDILSKQYLYSKNPLLIVMETPSQQAKDELAAERKIRRTLTRQLHEREDEIERLKAENRISAEEYREALQQLYSNQENNEQLISEMAERYTKIDYDYIDEFYIQVSSFILNGELTKADSMLNAKGNISSDIESLNHLKEVNAKERAELSKRQRKLEKSEAMAQYQLEEIAQRCYSKYEIFKMQHQNDSALYYLELRASLDTMNVEWLMDAGEFASEYMADYDKAMLYYEKTLENAKSQYGEKSRYVVECYMLMGKLYVIYGEYEKSLEYFSTSLDMVKKLYINDKVFISYIINNIGCVYHDLSNYELALTYYDEALKLCGSDTGEITIDVANVYENMASLYDDIGQYDKAEKYYLKVLDFYKEKFGENALETSLPYLGLGCIYSEKGMYSQSLEYLYKSIEIREAYFKDEHPRLSLVYNILGTIYYEIGEYDLAYEFLNKALENRKLLFGESHPSVLTSYNNISVLCASINRVDEGIEIAKKILDKRIMLLGENHADVARSYNNIASFYYIVGNYDNVIYYYRKSLEIKQNLYGENHNEVANILSNMSYVFREQKKYDEALEYTYRGLSVYKALFGDNHIDIALIYKSLGGIYAEQNKYDDALKSYDKSLEISRILLENENTKNILDNISDCYYRMAKINLIMKKYDEAMDNVMKSIAVDTDTYGEDCEYVVSGINLMGDIFYHKGEYFKSLEYYQKSLDILLLHVEKNHENVVEIESKINEINSIINSNK